MYDCFAGQLWKNPPGLGLFNVPKEVRASRVGRREGGLIGTWHFTRCPSHVSFDYSVHDAD
jgi:hypothetical protein